MNEKELQDYIAAVQAGDFDTAKAFGNLLQALEERMEPERPTQDEVKQVMLAWLDRQGELNKYA